MKLDNKRIVLTGASSGIGEALLEKLLEYNVKILVGDLTPAKVKKAKGKVFPIKCDVSKKSEVDALFKTAKKELGGIDIFIANAGFAYYEKIEKEDWNHAEKIFSTNFISPVYATEKMATFNKDGKYMVVVTASAMAKLAMPGYALYSATKASLDSFASGYRHEMDKRGTLSIVYPIATKTKFFDVAAKGTPVPFPTQTPEKVAKAIIRGIKCNKKSIHPSKLFYSMMILNRFFPFLFVIYTAMERWKLNKWYKNKKK